MLIGLLERASVRALCRQPLAEQLVAIPLYHVTALVRQLTDGASRETYTITT